MNRLVFINDIFARGGPSVWLRRACERLPRHGWECKLVMATPGIDYPDEWGLWPSELDIIPPTYSWHTLAARMARSIRSFAPDVIVAGAPWPMIYRSVRFLANSSRTIPRFVDTVLQDSPDQYDRLRNNLNITTAVVAVSASIAARVQEQIPAFAQRTWRFWTPVQVPPALPTRVENQPLRLVYLGRLTQRSKRILDLAEVIKRLSTRVSDFQFTIIGDGPERCEMERLLCGIPDGKVCFTGWLGSDKVAALLAEQDAMVMVSEAEGQPVALLEAMAHGVVPVVSDIPGNRELIRPGEQGCLVPVGDLDGFSTAVVQLAENRGWLRAMSRAAHELMQTTCAIDVAVAQFAGILEEVKRLDPPAQKGRVPVGLPAGTMDQLHVPQRLQALKRWFMGQVVY